MKYCSILLFGVFIVACGNNNKYYNTVLQTNSFQIEFYKPAVFKLVKLDTLRYSFADNSVYEYQDSRDTNITIAIQYTNKQIEKFDCDLKCMLNNFLIDMTSAPDPQSQYSYISKINGKDFARIHYNIYKYKYVCDIVFAKYKEIRVIARIAGWNYDTSDTVKYTSMRDSLFNSIHLDRQ